MCGLVGAKSRPSVGLATRDGPAPAAYAGALDFLSVAPGNGGAAAAETVCDGVCLYTETNYSVIFYDFGYFLDKPDYYRLHFSPTQMYFMFRLQIVFTFFFFGGKKIQNKSPYVGGGLSL